MRQHPIPQNILDIEFKLFTKFTVREFVYMAVGIGFGGIFLYFFTRGEMPALIAIPVFLVSSGIGLFLGLVPINDQKADVFLKNYIIAITSPTRRVWRSKNMTEEMNDRMVDEKVLEATKGTMERKTEEGANNIIGAENVSSKYQFVEKTVLDELDKEEQKRLEELEQNISEQTGPVITNTTPVQAPTVQQTETPVNRPIVIPRLSINSTNISRFLYPDNGNTNTITVIDNQGNPLSQAVIALKDMNDKVILAQKTNEKGYTVIDRELGKGKYQLVIASPTSLFPEVYIELEDKLPSIKISAL